MPYAIPVSYLVRGRRGCSMRKIFPLRINYRHPPTPRGGHPLPQALDILHILTPSTWCLFINSTSPPPPPFNCHVPVYHPTSTKQPINSTKHLCLYFLFPLLIVPYRHDHTIHWISFLSMCHFPVSFSPLPCSAFICQYACLVPCLFVCIAVILPLRKSTRIKPSGHVTMDLYHSSL